MEAPQETVNSVAISDFWDPLYDSFDVDLIMKVLAHTLFSTSSWLPPRLLISRDIFYRSILYFLHPHLLLLPRRSLARAHPRLLQLLQRVPLCLLCVEDHALLHCHPLSCSAGFLRWYSRLYRNQGSLIFGPPRLDWGDELVVITGGAPCDFLSSY